MEPGPAERHQMAGGGNALVHSTKGLNDRRLHIALPIAGYQVRWIGIGQVAANRMQSGMNRTIVIR